MTVAVVSKQDQETAIIDRNLECLTLQLKENYTTGVHCPRVWDAVLCWPPTVNGTTVTQPCPTYVNGFEIGAQASRRCDSHGHWWVHPEHNTTWTNLSLCSAHSVEYGDVPELIEAHVPRIRLMYNIGYGISLVSLLLAVAIMLYIKRLHCPRNTIHINLFVSFIFRATISFAKENALVNSVGFSFDVEYKENGEVIFLDNGTHWQCKAFFSLFNYVICANYMWIFVEGIYLHMLITFAMFSEKSSIRRFVLFGWGAPVLFVIPWVIVRARLDDVLCWNTHPIAGYLWLIRGPIVAVIVINFFIFLNIIRVLFTKLSAFRTSDAKRYRYRKLAKSTLILIPLFGVHYIVFIGVPDGINDTVELVRLYYEMFFNSFQGFFVSLLFCFLNAEVQSEIRKKWRRFRIKHGGDGIRRRSTRDTVTSFTTRGGRDSIASSIALNIDKEIANGNVLHINGLNRLSSSSGSSDRFQRNGYTEKDLEKSTYESHPMITITSPSPFEGSNWTEMQPILNNNNCPEEIKQGQEGT